LNLTDLESKVMNVVWDLSGKATVNQILQNWKHEKVPKYTTVLKILQILEEKGVVGHRKKGKAYLYIARMSKGDSLSHNLKKVINDFFGGKKALLASTLISDTRFTEEELQELKEVIAQKEKEGTNASEHN